MHAFISSTICTHAVSSVRGETVIGSIEYPIVHIYISFIGQSNFLRAHDNLSLLEGGLFWRMEYHICINYHNGFVTEK